MTKLNLKEIEARCDAATKGPWLAHKDIVHCGKENGHETVTERLFFCVLPNKLKNAEFISAARTDVPLLVACIRELLNVCDGCSLLDEDARAVEEFKKKWNLE